MAKNNKGWKNVTKSCDIKRWISESKKNWPQNSCLEYFRQFSDQIGTLILKSWVIPKSCNWFPPFSSSNCYSWKFSPSRWFIAWKNGGWVARGTGIILSCGLTETSGMKWFVSSPNQKTIDTWYTSGKDWLMKKTNNPTCSQSQKKILWIRFSISFTLQLSNIAGWKLSHFKWISSCKQIAFPLAMLTEQYLASVNHPKFSFSESSFVNIAKHHPAMRNKDNYMIVKERNWNL